jgi:hypothetical protein
MRTHPTAGFWFPVVSRNLYLSALTARTHRRGNTPVSGNRQKPETGDEVCQVTANMV